ncbi:MAG: T9SS type A sorting domain-containing protein [Fimbriimonadaceae bacterium]|nr:T9SS type A sorting domain-containing protein [Chitinophagales bacterium]
MRNFLYTFIATIFATSLFAQTYVERVFILNEGYYDYFSGDILTPVSLGAYDPETEIYTVVDEIENARFASDIKVYDDHYYVAADKYLIQYNLLTNEIVNSIEIPGIRKIAVDDNYIVATRGEYLVPFESYIHVYDKNTFELIFEIENTELDYTTEGVLIKDGIAYVAVNNGFNFGSEVGMIAKIDLTTQDLTEIIDLGTDGKNPDNIMIDGDNIFTLNNKDYTGSSVSAYKISTGDITTTNLINISAGCGTSVYSDGNIYYQELFGTSVSKYEPLTTSFIGEKEFGMSFYGLAFDELNNIIYTSETDYFSYGKIHIYGLNGTELKVFDASISPGNIAFDVRTLSSVNDVNTTEIKIYPNPASEFIQLSAREDIAIIKISDINGKVIDELKDVHSFNYSYSTERLVAGNYFVSVITENAATTKLISVL